MDLDTELDDNYGDLSVSVRTGRQFSTDTQSIYLFAQHQFPVKCNSMPLWDVNELI